MHASMQAVKRDEEARGVSRAGAMYGARQLLYRLASATQGVITALVMSAFGFLPAATHQPWSSKLGLCLLVGVIPCVLYLCAALVLSHLLHLQRHERDTTSK